MARLGSAFALTDISALHLRRDADGKPRLRAMRMLVALPEEGGGDGPRRNSTPPPANPSQRRADLVAAWQSQPALPFASVLPSCPIEARDLVEP